MPAFPKPPSRAHEKRRRRVLERAVIALVRAACVARDGRCHVFRRTSVPCAGPSEWAHAHPARRSKTRGKPPEERHTPEQSLILCARHHDMYDNVDGRWRLFIDPVDCRLGMNGETRVVLARVC